MEFNLALNTVIYIMIFIVPGFLFRSFFYRNEFAKEFYFGNLFERFIWTLFFSVLMLFVCFLLISFFLWCGIDLIPQISYETIREIHYNIHQQSDIILPDKATFFTKSGSFFTFITILWGQSILLGYILHNIAVIFNYNFYNYWYALLRGKKNPIPKNFKYSYTQVDILTHNNALYQGMYKKHYLSKSDNDLETIFLEKVRKKEKGGSFKAIPGHNFCVHKGDINNINLSYIYIKKDEKQRKLVRYFIGIIIYLIIFLAFFLVIYTNQITALKTFRQKIIFFFSIFSILSILANTLLSFKKPTKESVFIFLFFIWIAIASYFDLNIGITILAAIVILMGGTYNISKDEKQSLNSGPTVIKKTIRKPRKPYQRRSYQRRSYKKKRQERYTRKINRQYPLKKFKK